MNALYKPFHFHIVDCIRKGDYAIATDFWGDEYIVNKDRLSDERRPMKNLNWAANAEGPNEWSMRLNLWMFGLFPRVHIRRGEEHFSINLKGVDARNMGHIIRAIFAERKDLARHEKMRYRTAQQNAYFLDEDTKCLIA